jgi:hypothetical protein
MTDKNIQKLIDKYLEGATSPAEERQLAQELLRPDIPEEWQTIRLMLGELTMGEAQYDSIMAQHKQRPSAILIVIRIISSIAALYLIGLFFWLQQTPETETKTAYYNKVEQPQPAPQPQYCTEGTPREILMCYLEHRQAQPDTYRQLKQRTYENE